MRRSESPAFSHGTSVEEIMHSLTIIANLFNQLPVPSTVARLPSHHSSCSSALASLRRTRISDPYIILNCTLDYITRRVRLAGPWEADASALSRSPSLSSGA